MKFLSLLLITGFLNQVPIWETDFSEAQQKAQQNHKFMLVSFSGSDWCIPCIKMHKEIFDTEAFTSYADSNLILVNADFPRLKKNSLSKEQQKKNDALADKYDRQGIFPYTILLDEKGEVIKTWEGYPNVTPEQFTVQLKKALDVRK